MMNAAPIEIIGFPQGNFLRAVRMAAAEKGLSYVLHPVMPHSPEADEVHPLGLVPGLRHGEVKLGESQAIVAYLDRLHPETPMGPAGAPAEAAEVAQWSSIVATFVDRILIRRYCFAYIFPKTADGSPNRTEIEAVLPELHRVFAMLQARLQGRDFLAANRFSFADALLLATLDAVIRFPEAAEAVARAPAVGRYVALHGERPSFVETQPSR